MKKQWRVAYFGCLGNIVTTGRMTKRKAARLFKTFRDAFALEKINERGERKIFKEKNPV